MTPDVRIGFLAAAAQLRHSSAQQTAVTPQPTFNQRVDAALAMPLSEMRYDPEAGLGFAH